LNRSARADDGPFCQEHADTQRDDFTKETRCIDWQ